MLSSAAFHAFCVTLPEVGILKESRINVQFFFGLVVLFNILFLWSFGLILHKPDWNCSNDRVVAMPFVASS